MVADLKTKIDFLTRRVANLEEVARKNNDPGERSRFEAPFEVVDREGNPILVVTDAQYPAAKRRGRVHIGRATGGTNYSILAHNQGGAVVAGIGEGRESGSGSIMLADRSGATRVQLFSENGLTINNKGHTDSIGGDASNRALSERRAQAAGDRLVKHGVDAARLRAAGFAASKPREPNATIERRARNRRVELYLKNAGVVM